MAGKSRRGDGVTVSFGAKFAQSDQFRTVFREGMALVEAAATCLDGDGRKEARKLQPPQSLAYATESMRLTTRLMQLASWLLIRRAVSEGELTLEQAFEEQRKIKLPAKGGDQPGRDFGALPARLKELIVQSVKLQERIVRLDQMLGLEQAPAPAAAEPPSPLEHAAVALTRGVRHRQRLTAYLRKPSYFRLKRDSRPPRSVRCWLPPVQAGWVLESMSSFSVSPSAP